MAFAAQLEVQGVAGKLARWRLLAQARSAGRHILADLKHYVEHGGPSARKQHQTVSPAIRRLRRALRANAAFSLSSGAALPAAGWFLAEPWDLGAAWLPPAVGPAWRSSVC